MSAISDPNQTPPMGQAIPLGLQHVLAMFASNVTPSIIVAGAAGLAFGGAEQVYLIQMAMLFAGIATLFQTVGVGPVGARLPIMQGTSFAFVGVLAGVAATQGLGVALTACLIGGIIHFLLGSVIQQIRFLFPPMVIGLVILAIGLYLMPVAIKYATLKLLITSTALWPRSALPIMASKPRSSIISVNLSIRVAVVGPAGPTTSPITGSTGPT